MRPRHELGKQPNPACFEPGSGNYIILSCGGADEQSGCPDWNSVFVGIPSDRWVTINQLGMNWRLRNDR